jgi:O-antigen/teichoic acid export membrane protein
VSIEAKAWTFRPALQLMAGRLIGFVATFFVPIVLVRVFAPEIFGTYKQLFLVFTTLFALAQVGMAESLFYFLTRDRDDADACAGYQANSLIALSLSGLVVLAALTVGARPLAAWLNNPSLAPLLPLLGVYLMLMLASAGFEITLLCRQRFVRAAATYAISDLLRAALLVLPVLLFDDLAWLLVGALAFATVRLAAHLVLLRRRYGAKLRPSRAHLAKQLAYSLPFQIAIVVEVVQANLHQYAVSYWFDPATFAIYAVGCLQIPLVDFAASSSGNVLMVGMGDALRRGDPAAARSIWLDTTQKLGLLLLPLVTLLVLVAADLIPFLFTDAYRACVGVFGVWTTAVVLSVFQTDSALRVFAAVRTILLLNVVRLVIVGGLIAWAVSAAGLVGAVAATVLATAVAKGLALVRLRQLLDTEWSRLLPWKALLSIAGASVAAAVPAALLQPRLERGTALTLCVLGVTYLGVLLPLLFVLGIVDLEVVPARIRRLWRLLDRRVPVQPDPTETA